MKTMRTATTLDGPRYELRLIPGRKSGRWHLELWQVPAFATPHIKAGERVATIRGRPLQLVETRLLRRLTKESIDLPESGIANPVLWPVREEVALMLALLFRVVSSLRSIDRIRSIADGIESMSREEAAFWLGKAMNHKSPRRVLAALRMIVE